MVLYLSAKIKEESRGPSILDLKSPDSEGSIFLLHTDLLCSSIHSRIRVDVICKFMLDGITAMVLVQAFRIWAQWLALGTPPSSRSFTNSSGWEGEADVPIWSPAQAPQLLPSCSSGPESRCSALSPGKHSYKGFLRAGPPML